MLAPPDLVPVGTASDFRQSHRWVLSFRSWRHPAHHSQILIYRSPESPSSSTPPNDRWYSIANECPHLGLPLEAGDIEDFGPVSSLSLDDQLDDEDPPVDQPIIICPFHQYDFGLRDGRGSSGSTACTYKVEVRDGRVWVEPPGDKSDDYRLLGVRMVSEQFADSAPTPAAVDIAPLLSGSGVDAPTSIVGWCRFILLAPSPTAKVALTRHLVALFRSGQLTRLSDPVRDVPHPSEPYRDPLVKTVRPGQASTLGKAGSAQNRVKLLHALAAIEQWAIDLAIDCVSRFHAWKTGTTEGTEGKKMPWTFVSDFLKVAEDEAKHFTLLVERLDEMGCKYGDLAVHNGLWESATTTSHSLFSRLAIIHLVHEARGLDSNPMQIKRCRAAGDERSAQVLEVIHYDEITHVAAGHRHFLHLCETHSPPLDPVATFRREVETHFHGRLRGPFNDEDREKAGLDKGYYEGLNGRGFASRPRVDDAARPVTGRGDVRA
ncbi:hypothetical protein JCM10212_001776 [Sporobolomyces blumeae]